MNSPMSPSLKKRGRTPEGVDGGVEVSGRGTQLSLRSAWKADV